MNSVIKELEWRKILKDIANKENLEYIFKNKKAFYVGIDPTADSIHIGHYMIFSLAKIISKKGLAPIFVIGGFTGIIGDPSGKNIERKIISKEIIDKNVKALKIQINYLAKKLKIKNFKIINNNDIYKNLTIVDLFQKFGKHFNVNTMLNKEMVKNRLDTGISFTEFSYQIFQAIDFFNLFKKYNVCLQVSGSDQWGNLTSGIELIKKIEGRNSKISGMTVNLLVDKNGNKIGKTEGNPIWLDERKFSKYLFYQYVINLDDKTAESMLLALTEITKNKYETIKNLTIEKPKRKFFQYELAKRLMSQIYDVDSYDKVAKASLLIFNDEYENLDLNIIKDVFNNIPEIKNRKTFLFDTLLDSKIILSKREFREFLNNWAIKVNGKKIVDENFKLTNDCFINNKFMIINVGKKKRYIIWK